MYTGTELLALKREAHAASLAADERDMKGYGWFMLLWLYALIAIGFSMMGMLAGLLSLTGSNTAHPLTPMESLASIGLAVVAGATALLAFRAPSIIKSRDKTLDRLHEEKEATKSTYAKAVAAELATYGIDVDSMDTHNSYMSAVFEFTALRNGDPIDVTVRHFNDEIVFMLNGERMKKPVTV